MAILVSLNTVSKAFGAEPLFENISFGISDGERLGIIGPNGAGKSTLMRIVAGVQPPDTGDVAHRKLLRLAYVPQESLFPERQTVREVLIQANSGHDEPAVDVTLGKAGLGDRKAEAHTLSGGQRKRLAIACALVREPELLMLDEPTNHLDLEGIEWLENMLVGAPFASIVISHDRYFLENVATDMAEISPAYAGGFFRVRGSYSEFLLKREEWMLAQSKQRESLQNRVRGEVEWLRRGPKARTTKSKARIDSAGRLIRQLADLNSRAGARTSQIDFTASDRKTKKLIDAHEVKKSLGGRELFHKARFTLSPGTRLGLVGPNGSGKTTLLKIIAGQIEPDGGVIDRADFLKIVYFDQHREHLEPGIRLRNALCPHGDSVIYRERPIHVASWANRFLFSSEQLEMPVDRLSGGERARIHIANLMLQPADILLLDEPTNDLDIPTLEVLEESLLEFDGSLVLVTHDRYMLDRVSTAVLGLDGRGDAGLYADYLQWEQAMEAAARLVRAPGSEPRSPAIGLAGTKRKLSYMEGREWGQIEAKIHDAEAELAQSQAAMNDPAIATDATKLHDAYVRMQAAQAEVDRLYERWAELEAKFA